MPFLSVLTPAGPATLNLARHAATLERLFVLAALPGEARFPLPASRGMNARHGLVTPDAPLGAPENLTLDVVVHAGQVTVQGVPLSRAMLHIRVDAHPGSLHPCTLCRGLTTSDDRVCQGCASAYSHWITQGDTCPACGELRLVRCLHEGSLTGWEECHACDYHANLTSEAA